MSKVRKLTKQEQFLFSLTPSCATSPELQRLAIKHAGLDGATRAAVRAEQLKRWREVRNKHKGVPSWVLAARFSHFVGYDKPPVKAGTAITCTHLQVLAFEEANWGKVRKREYGRGTANPPRIRTRDNGRVGWKRVVWHHADYLCVLSPDGKQVAIQVRASDPIRICTVWRGRCKFEGEVFRLIKQEPTEVRKRNARDTANLFRRAGFEARVVRQDCAMVSAGSGETLRDRKTGELCCVVPDGFGGWYHIANYEKPDEIRRAIRRRLVNSRASRLDELIQQHAERIWVGLNDSISGGNCSSGTQAFAQQFVREIAADGELGAATAAAILRVRNDDFTRRACRVAALRYERKLSGSGVLVGVED